MSMAKGAFMLAFFTVIAKLAGLVRERLLAAMFGAGEITDAYFAAFKIPDFVFTTLVLGALSAAFIPVFIDVREREGEAQAWRLAGKVLTWLTVLLSALALLAFLGAPALMRLLVPGFTSATATLAIALTRIMLLSMLFFGASNVMGGILNASHSYIALSLAPVFYNIGIIIGIVWFVPVFGPLGLGWGVVLGSLLHFLIQAPGVLRMAQGQLQLGFALDQAVRRIIALMGPRLLGLAASQINGVVITALASAMITGSVAVYNFAFNLVSFPVGVIGISFAVAAFPYFAQHAARQERDQFVARFRASVTHVLAVLIPLSLFLIFLRAQVVRVVLGTGAFDLTDMVSTANTLGFLALALSVDGVIPLLARSFYAFSDTWTPVKIGVGAVAMNLVLALILKRYGIEGIALAFALTQIIQGTLLALSLHRRIPGIFDFSFAEGLVKIMAAAAVGAAVLQLLKAPIASVVDMETGIGVLLQGFGSGVGGVVVYYALARYFKCPGVLSFKGILEFVKTPMR